MDWETNVFVVKLSLSIILFLMARNIYHVFLGHALQCILGKLYYLVERGRSKNNKPQVLWQKSVFVIGRKVLDSTQLLFSSLLSTISEHHWSYQKNASLVYANGLIKVILLDCYGISL